VSIQRYEYPIAHRLAVAVADGEGVRIHISIVNDMAALIPRNDVAMGISLAALVLQMVMAPPGLGLSL
jgi:hypothetical protein